MAIPELNNLTEEKTCILCGEGLRHIDKKIKEHCDFCGRETKDYYQCGNQHIICHECVSMPVNEYVKNECLRFKSTDPIELAVNIMNSPLINMHGAEHHFIVPAVLLTCIHNHLKVPTSLENKLNEAEKRAVKETPQFCDFKNGNCGAAVGTGLFLSIHLGRDLENEDEWSLYNDIIAKSLQYIKDHGGPRCCKRDTYLSLQASVDFMRERFAIELPYSEAHCTFSLRNKTCGREECDYYNIGFSLV